MEQHRAGDGLDVSPAIGALAHHPVSEVVQPDAVEFQLLAEGCESLAGAIGAARELPHRITSEHVGARRQGGADLAVLRLLDEVSMGLAPSWSTRSWLPRASRRHRNTLFLVEQYVGMALELADIVYVLQKGRVAFCRADELDSSALTDSYLGG